MAQSQNQLKKQESSKPLANESIEPVQSKNTVDKGEYDAYTNLKFISFSGTKLSDEQKKWIVDMENKFKNCDGAIPIKTVRAAIKNEQVLMVKGVPLPSEYLEIIINAGERAEKYYIG